MLVGIAMAALSYLGAKGNYGNALKIASSMPTGGLPALAMVGGPQTGSGAGAHGLIAPGTGSFGVGGAMMAKAEGEGGGGESSKIEQPKSGQPANTSPGNRGGRLIIPDGRTFSEPELAIAKQLVNEDHTVEALAESSTRTADFLVDGARTELKSISNITSPDISGALCRRILDGAGQAPHIIADLQQQTGITLDLAQRAARRAYGAVRANRIQSIRLLGQDFDVTMPRIPLP